MGFLKQVSSVARELGISYIRIVIIKASFLVLLKDTKGAVRVPLVGQRDS